MRSFAHYISKHLISFATFILILLFLNAVVFGLTFQKVVTEDYGTSSPHPMLEMTAAAATPERLSDDAAQKLRQNHIWAIYLNADGQCYWSVDLPDEVPKSYTIQDVALFSKGYIEDYPVFVWPVNAESLVEKTEKLLKELKKLINTADNGRKIQEGIRTVIVGKPNAGKSSLLNVLVGEDRAIVTS